MAQLGGRVMSPLTVSIGILGNYIKKLDELEAGDEKVRATLRLSIPRTS